MSEWQPIETAPRDSKKYVLVHSKRSGSVAIARYLAWRGIGDWISDCGAVLFEKHEPTHWMPLPEPPAEAKDPK